MTSVPDESGDTPLLSERDRLRTQALHDLEGFKRKLIEFCEGRQFGTESDRTSDEVYAADERLRSRRGRGKRSTATPSRNAKSTRGGQIRDYEAPLYTLTHLIQHIPWRMRRSDMRL